MRQTTPQFLMLVLLTGLFMVTALFSSATAQTAAQDTSFRPHGKLSGYAFGDYYYKADADPLKRGNGAYAGIPSGKNAFQFRRVYLGYDYDISRKFSAQVLLAAEDASDALASNKYAFYVKYANLRWKGILPRTDLVIGQTATPAFSGSSEPVWGYRSIEKTIADIRKTPSYDLGVSVQGKFDAQGNFGYNLMVGNGSGAKPEGDRFKHFYADVYGLFFGRLKVDLYGDYERLDWQEGFHHSRSMGKLFAGYQTPRITVGAEGFLTWSSQDVTAMNVKTGVADTLNGVAAGLSLFAHGPVIKDKLGFFARTDFFNPDIKYDGSRYGNYGSFSAAYSPANKEQFITAGLDFTPVKNVHLMPNIWYTRYSGQDLQDYPQDYDLVYRLTFYFIYK
jgi:hypothetical protein